MVVLNKIYTRTGDGGDTALGDGARVPKHAPRVAAYGASDETNAAIGLARLHAEGEMDAALARIQNDLFDLGADLCVPDMASDADAEYPRLRMNAAQVARLEAEIDEMNRALAPLRSFILPGDGVGRVSPSLPHDLPEGGARRDRTGDAGGSESGGVEIPEPSFRLVFRRRPGRQR